MKLDTLKAITNHPLTKDNKIRTLIRFFKRGLLIRLHQGGVVYPFLGDTQLLVKKGMSSAELQVYTGMYEFDDMFFVVHLLDKEDVFVDVGANVGVYTVLASGVKRARTIALEPDPDTFKNLLNNVALNHLTDKVRLLNLGVGEKKETVKFTKGLGAINHIKRDEDGEGEFNEIQIESLDDILKNDNPTLIKVDVEGFETQVIKGAVETLKKPSLKGIIIELNGLASKYSYEEHFIHKTLVDHGFKPYAYDPFARQLQALEKHGDENTLYLRDVEWIKNRIKASPRYQVLDKSI
ncbi:MAG TPA: FkbM family methyltransferase [Cytophagaceae bacterium]|jgi:FkbM family methyltransferase|nr:FkbM family methyltransferase [Cytophagaceae bacterium]